jgi:glutathione S-transferase
MSNEQARILYTFRRCPYAIRARMAIFTAGIEVELREVSLKNKPQDMLDVSRKGTVPVLCDGTKVIDESLDIMLWALAINDPDQWCSRYSETQKATAMQLIDENDNDFKNWLDKYKYADRHPEHEPEYYRHQGTNFLAKLDNNLQKQRHLITSAITMADIAIFPFVRQFSMVDREWFDQCDFKALRIWLDKLLEMPVFKLVMAKQEKTRG